MPLPLPFPLVFPVPGSRLMVMTFSEEPVRGLSWSSEGKDMFFGVLRGGRIGFEGFGGAIM